MVQENEEFEIDEDENTISILNRYIDEAEFECDKNIIKGIFQKSIHASMRGRVMFLLTLKDRKEDGAYAVQNALGEKVLFLFEEEDDAERYAMMMEDDEE